MKGDPSFSSRRKENAGPAHISLPTLATVGKEYHVTNLAAVVKGVVSANTDIILDDKNYGRNQIVRFI